MHSHLSVRCITSKFGEGSLCLLTRFTTSEADQAGGVAIESRGDLLVFTRDFPARLYTVSRYTPRLRNNEHLFLRRKTDFTLSCQNMVDTGNGKGQTCVRPLA